MDGSSDVIMAESEHHSMASSTLDSETGVCEAVDRVPVRHEVMEMGEPLPSVEESTTPPPPSEARAFEPSCSRNLRSGAAAAELKTTPEGGAENIPVELPSEAEMIRRLVVLCVGGQGPPTVSCGRVPGLKATNMLIHRAVLVVFRFFRERMSEIRWVTEKGQLDKMDGLAYLLADLLRGELLLEEANLIGKRAHKHVSTDVPKREKELTKQANSDRSYARTRVKRGQLDASTIDNLLAGIDRRRDEAIAELWQEEYTALGLPAENTVVVESRARAPEDSAEIAAVELMRTLAETIKEADETVTFKSAELDSLNALIDGAKAKLRRLMQREPPKRKGRITPELIERRQQQMTEVRDAHRSLENLVHVWEETSRDLEDAIQMGDDAQQQLSALRAERLRPLEERLQEARTCERESRVRLQDNALLRESLEARLAAAAAVEALDAAVEPAEVAECRARLERAAVRADLSRDAERVWGARRATPRAASVGKVFKLSGLSAEETRGLASEVSQEATSREEHIAHARAADRAHADAPDPEPADPVAGVPVVAGAPDVVVGVAV